MNNQNFVFHGQITIVIHSTIKLTKKSICFNQENGEDDEEEEDVSGEGDSDTYEADNDDDIHRYVNEVCWILFSFVYLFK